jgi:ATP-dependent DNA helicase RecQ
MNNCGLCDNCLQQKNTILTDEEFLKIEQQIFTHISKRAGDIKGLLFELKTIKKSKVWTVLNYLQSEKKIVVDKDGVIQRAN